MDILEIKTFKTNDGSIFKSLCDAKKYNELLKECDNIENALISCPHDIDFTNGIGWIIHPKNTKINLEKSIVKLYNNWFEDRETKINYAVGRFTSDSGIKCLNHLIYRWQCITSKNIEYGQPYYANNTSKAVGGAINK